MSRQTTAGFLLGAGLGLLGGVVLSLGEAERRARKSYEESSAALMRAMERTRTVATAETPAAEEKDLITEIGPPGEASAGGELTREGDEPIPQYINHYRNAVESTDPTKETSVDMFVEGGINDYGVSYIEEEEFYEEDGRFKGQITLVLNDNNAAFFMDGVEIKDWDDRLGDSILVDFYRLVPPNAPPILYVRNHKRDEDYEVTREIP